MTIVIDLEYDRIDGRSENRGLQECCYRFQLQIDEIRDSVHAGVSHTGMQVQPIQLHAIDRIQHNNNPWVWKIIYC